VGKVVERVLEDEKEGNLPGDRPERGEGDRVGRHAEILSHRMEAPDLRARTKARQQRGQGRRERRTRGEGKAHLGELDGKVREEDELCAVPLLLGGRDLARLQLPLVEVGDAVDDDEGEAAAKVDDLGHGGRAVSRRFRRVGRGREGGWGSQRARRVATRSRRR
jgi:hypothetical protein